MESLCIATRAIDAKTLSKRPQKTAQMHFWTHFAILNFRIFDFSAKIFFGIGNFQISWICDHLLEDARRCSPKVCRKLTPEKYFSVEILFFAKTLQKLHSCTKSPTGSKNSARGVQNTADMKSWFSDRISRISRIQDNFLGEPFLLPRRRL